MLDITPLQAGTRNFALRQETLYLTALINNPIRTNTDVQMNSMHMKCGVQQTSEESSLTESSKLIEMRLTTISNGFSRTI